MTDTRFYPSITAQTRWRCGFFNFDGPSGQNGRGGREQYAFFNPGLVERPDGLWLIARRSKNERRFRVGFNDLVAAKLEEGTYQVKGYVPIVTRHYFDREHFEDPRAIYHNGVTYISACNFVIVNNGNGWTGAHQTMNAIHGTHWSRHWQVQERFDPVFGYNGARIGQDTGMEKNWLWWVAPTGHQRDAGLNFYLVYKASPHVVAQFDSQFIFMQEFKTENDASKKWPYGTIRGGTPPVMVNGEYLTFFHSSLPTGDQYHRRYYMGAYTFEAQPPFTMKRMTMEPLLVGSWQDRWAPNKPLVVFPCGSRLKHGNWLVTMGVNDLEAAWIEIPQLELDQLLRPLIPERSLVGRLIDKLTNKEKDECIHVG